MNRNIIYQITILVNKKNIHKMKLWRIGIRIYLWPQYQQIDSWQIYLRTIHKLFANREPFAEHCVRSVKFVKSVRFGFGWSVRPSVRPSVTIISTWDACASQNLRRTQNFVVLLIMDMVSAKSYVNGRKKKYVFCYFVLKSDKNPQNCLKNVWTQFVVDQTRTSIV